MSFRLLESVKRSNAHRPMKGQITMEEQNTVKTNFRKLENFLYLMGIAPMNTFKDWDGATAWEYEDTAELRLAVQTF